MAKLFPYANEENLIPYKSLKAVSIHALAWSATRQNGLCACIMERLTVH